MEFIGEKVLYLLHLSSISHPRTSEPSVLDEKRIKPSRSYCYKPLSKGELNPWVLRVTGPKFADDQRQMIKANEQYLKQVGIVPSHTSL